ncbi:MAG: hypothetical protein ABR988_10140 [Terriglobales bacterium]
MVVADQNDSSVGDLVADIAGGENLLVGAVGLAKVAEIFASGGGINGANLTLLRPAAGSMARISRSTLAIAWSWAALRRDRKMPVVAINPSLVVRRSLSLTNCRSLAPLGMTSQ